MRRQTERLLNLLIALRSAQGWIDRERLRRSIPDYRDLDEAAFDRQFTRDKQALTDLGIHIQSTDWGDPFTGDTGYGYRIEESDYALTQIDFTPEEAALVSVSRTLLDDTALAADAGSALNKLRGLGEGFDSGTPSAEASEAAVLSAHLPGSVAGTAFADLLRALEARRSVRFDYRRPGGEVSLRRLEPYALLTRGDRSYVMGRDLDRDAVRAFRLTRITGRISRLPRRTDGDYAIPEDFVASEHFAPDRAAQNPEFLAETRTPAVRCLLAVEPGRALPLREEGVPAPVPAEARAPAGWDGLDLPTADPARLAERLLEFSPSVLVLAPMTLREEHRRLLGDTVRALEDATGGPDGR